jgi:hypothetical protein
LDEVDMVGVDERCLTCGCVCEDANSTRVAQHSTSLSTPARVGHEMDPHTEAS